MFAVRDSCMETVQGNTFILTYLTAQLLHKIIMNVSKGGVEICTRFSFNSPIT